MERKLSRLFDMQKFHQNHRLAKVISDVESRYASAVSDDDLELVNAAGDIPAVVPEHPLADRVTEREQPLVFIDPEEDS